MKDRTKESKKALHICLLVAFLSVLGAVVYVMFFTELVPPITQTGLAMNNCKQRIQQYAIEHNAMPGSLNDTNEIKGTFNSNKDGWGHEILYSVDANGIVTLTSLGKDNKHGGTGDNEDVTGTYQSRGLSGGWAGTNADWIKRPYKGMRNRR